MYFNVLPVELVSIQSMQFTRYNVQYAAEVFMTFYLSYIVIDKPNNAQL